MTNDYWDGSEEYYGGGGGAHVINYNKTTDTLSISGTRPGGSGGGGAGGSNGEDGYGGGGGGNVSKSTQIFGGSGRECWVGAPITGVVFPCALAHLISSAKTWTGLGIIGLLDTTISSHSTIG